MSKDTQAMTADLTRLRRGLHTHPEIGLELPRTQEMVLGALRGLPLEVTTGRGSTSVTAVLRGTALDGDADGGAARPSVLLRADMDALPVQEETGFPYASRIDGAMHACGHDLHTAMLVGAAHLLTGQRSRLSGDVVFMFQPGEEGWEGARVMIGEGVLDATGSRVAHAYGLHVFSTMPQCFHTRPGPMLAASSSLVVTVRGAGGHASAPHLAHDPIPAAAEMVLALQAMVARRFDVFDHVVLTVGILRAGTRRNVIPETATFEATVRTFSDDVTGRVRDEALQILYGLAAAHGVMVEARFTRERPATVNDVAETAFVDETVREVFGEDRYCRLAHPFTGSEDFSRVLAEVPGAIVALGALPDGADAAHAPYNHSGSAVFDDAVLPLGAALLAALAERRLTPSRRRQDALR